MILKNIASIIIIFSSIINAANSEDSRLDKVINKGEYTFLRFCSVCHGRDAKGEDTGLHNLSKLPPDLTLISLKNDGVFPWVKLFTVISGENDRPGHNPREMPEWSKDFDLHYWGHEDSDFVEDFSEEIVHGRILQLLLYLESIQQDKSK